MAMARKLDVLAQFIELVGKPERNWEVVDGRFNAVEFAIIFSTSAFNVAARFLLVFAPCREYAKGIRGAIRQ